MLIIILGELFMLCMLEYLEESVLMSRVTYIKMHKTCDGLRDREMGVQVDKW